MKRHSCTPLRPQFQTTECGIAVLQTMLAHFGLSVPMRELRLASGVTRDGVSAADIFRTAEMFGLACEIRRLKPESLATSSLPAVVHMKFIHFVVVEAFDTEKVGSTVPSPAGSTCRGRSSTRSSPA